MKNKFIKYYPFLPLLLLCGFYFFQAFDFPIHDFCNYYFGGKLLSEGHFNSNIYFPYEFNKAILDYGYLDVFASYAPNTPFLSFIFSAFSSLSALTAKTLFNCVSILLFVFSIKRLFSFYKIDSKLALLIPVLFLVPIKNNLLFGQVYFLLFFLLAEGWLAYENRNWKAMSFWWSFAILLKVFPLLLVVFLVFRKQWKPLLFLMIFCVILFGISIAFTGFDIWVFYLKEVLPKASNGEIATGFVDNYQSVFMFLKELLVFDATENPNAAFNLPVLFSALMVAFKIAVLVIGYFVSKRAALAFPFWILAMLLVSPYGSTYAHILLLIPFLALLPTDITNQKKWVFGILLFLICNIPTFLFINNPLPFSYLRLMLLLLFIILFLTQLKLRIHWKIVAVSFIIPLFTVLFLQKPEPVTSTILLNDSPILVYDYGIQINNETKNHYLKGSFWDGKEKVIFWKKTIQKYEPLKLKDNQVFYRNRQLTFDKSHKLKPILIDNKFVLYLSDYDRGIGFYTLRKITLP